MKIARSADANTIRNRPEYLPAHRCIVRLSASGASSAAISRVASEAESTSRFTPNGGAVAASTGVLPGGLVGAIFVVSAMAFGLPPADGLLGSREIRPDDSGGADADCNIERPLAILAD